MAPRLAALAFVGATLGAALLAGCADGPTDAAISPAETITASTVRAHIAALSADSMRGRFTPSPELDKAALWAVARFQAFGLAPGAGAGFVQTWTLPGGAAPNVIGVLEGSDPQLRSEYVLVVAHLDHIGTAGAGLGCAPAGADSICNGADDNASGSAAVLELARAFGSMAQRPRRSMVFLLVSGEEEGLLGSAWYVAHPAAPLAQTVAAINLDMIGRNATDSVLVVGTELTTLGILTTTAWQEHPELGMRPVGVPWPYGGSDHIPFGEAGVPALCFFAGLHADYHRPSDVVGLIDADKAARIVRLVYYLALAVADRTERPVWYAVARPPWQGAAARR